MTAACIDRFEDAPCRARRFSITELLLTLAVFIFPAVIAVVKTKAQSIVHLVLTGPAEWLLYSLTTIGELLAGGFIAMSA